MEPCDAPSRVFARGMLAYNTCVLRTRATSSRARIRNRRRDRVFGGCAVSRDEGRRRAVHAQLEPTRFVRERGAAAEPPRHRRRVVRGEFVRARVLDRGHRALHPERRGAHEHEEQRDGRQQRAQAGRLRAPLPAPSTARARRALTMRERHREHHDAAHPRAVAHTSATASLERTHPIRFAKRRPRGPLRRARAVTKKRKPVGDFRKSVSRGLRGPHLRHAMALALRLGLLATSARRASIASRPGRALTRTGVRTFAVGGDGASSTLFYHSPVRRKLTSTAFAHSPLPPIYTHVLPRVGNAHRRLFRRCHASRPREGHAPGRARSRGSRRGGRQPIPEGRRQRHLGYPEHGIRGPGEAPRRQERARGGFLTEGWTRFPGEGVPRAARVLRRAQRGRGGPSQADVRRVSEKANETKRKRKARARARRLHDGRSRTPPVIRWKRAAPMRFRATARVRTKTMTKRADGRVRCIWGDSLCSTSRQRRVKKKHPPALGPERRFYVRIRIRIERVRRGYQTISDYRRPRPPPPRPPPPRPPRPPRPPEPCGERSVGKRGGDARQSAESGKRASLEGEIIPRRAPPPASLSRDV